MTVSPTPEEKEQMVNARMKYFGCTPTQLPVPRLNAKTHPMNVEIRTKAESGEVSTESVLPEGHTTPAEQVDASKVPIPEHEEAGNEIDAMTKSEEVKPLDNPDPSAVSASSAKSKDTPPTAFDGSTIYSFGTPGVDEN